MNKIISVLVENKAGVLSRIAGLFARRGYNIESLVVCETEDSSISRMTIVTNGDTRTLEQVEKQLNKLIDVIKVQPLEKASAIRRELALIKVNTSSAARGEIMDICAIMGAKVADVYHTTITVEYSDRPEKIDLMLELLSVYGIIEVVRSGMVAIHRGSEAITLKK